MAPVLLVRFERRSDAVPLMRAALDAQIAEVALVQAPPAGVNTLQIHVGDELVATLTAELVGAGSEGAYPLQVGLLDPSAAAELRALVDAPDPGSAPAIVFLDEDKTLPSRGADDSLASPPPASHAVLPPRTPPPAAGEVPPESARRAPISSEEVALSGGGTSAAASFFTDDESQTLSGSSRMPGVPSKASWNVRIAPTTRDPLCGRTVGGGKYVLDSVIGTGAIGIVFKASHRDLGRTVAIKVLNPRYRDDPELLTVFQTEARAASQLEHPNVARVYDYGQEPDGLVYLVMEYLSGYTLGSVLEVRRKLTVARSIDVMVQVCAALSAAHDRDIVHRDVKPDNIVLVPVQDDEGQPVEIVKVCDFGIAALGSTDAGAGQAAGTPEYMAPEQTTGLSVAPSADVYACGVVLYEMLTGQVPFTDEQAYRILMKHRRDVPRPPSSLDAGVPRALEAVVLRCMEKLPAARYQSARELRIELRKL